MWVVSPESTVDTLCALYVLPVVARALLMKREDVVCVGVVVVFVGVVVGDLLQMTMVCDNW